MANVLAPDPTMTSGAPPPTAGKSLTSGNSGRLVGDRVYTAILFLSSLVILAIIVGIGILLAKASWQSIHEFGFHFLTSTVWDPNKNQFSAGSFIFGTLYSSFIGLLIAVPISIGAAIFLSEIAPKWIRTPVSFLIELLAAIPSVVYGLWGIFVMCPWLAANVETPIYEGSLFGTVATRIQNHVQAPLARNHHFSRMAPWVHAHMVMPLRAHNIMFSHMALFRDYPQGSDMLAASLILAIMVTPYITSVSRDILRAIPRVVRDGSFALGATQWETIKNVVLPYARAGIIGAVILGLGRALGETMAVTMVIGNSGAGLKLGLFAPGYTMASIIANELPEATTEIYRSSLIEIGLVLLGVTMIVNVCARFLVLYTAKDINSGGRR